MFARRATACGHTCITKAMVLAALLTTLCSTTIRAQETPEDIVALIDELGLYETESPIREHPRWRVPKKAVVVGMSADLVRDALPGVEIVEVADAAEALDVVADADILVGISVERGMCNPEVIASAKELRWIMSMSAGVDACLDYDVVRNGEVILTNTRGLGSGNIAEHVIGMMMTLARGLDSYILLNDSLVQGESNDPRGTRPRMQVIGGKTMLVVGLGAIGSQVAERAAALGMNVVATRNSGRHGPDYVSYVGLPDEMLTLAKTADVIVNATPLTDETVDLYDKEFFSVVKRNMIFINIARGESVVNEELYAALVEGRIAGAGLDVTFPEPLPPGHQLRTAPHIIITPHVSGGSDLPPSDRIAILRENMRRYLAGEEILSVIDPIRQY